MLTVLTQADSYTVTQALKSMRSSATVIDVRLRGGATQVHFIL